MKFSFCHVFVIKKERDGGGGGKKKEGGERNQTQSTTKVSDNMRLLIVCSMMLFVCSCLGGRGKRKGKRGKEDEGVLFTCTPKDMTLVNILLFCTTNWEKGTGRKKRREH